jgi:hypothetical protein
MTRVVENWQVNRVPAVGIIRIRGLSLQMLNTMTADSNSSSSCAADYHTPGAWAANLEVDMETFSFCYRLLQCCLGEEFQFQSPWLNKSEVSDEPKLNSPLILFPNQISVAFSQTKTLHQFIRPLFSLHPLPITVHHRSSSPFPPSLSNSKQKYPPNLNLLRLNRKKTPVSVSDIRLSLQWPLPLPL